MVVLPVTVVADGTVAAAMAVAGVAGSAPAEVAIAVAMAMVEEDVMAVMAEAADSSWEETQEGAAAGDLEHLAEMVSSREGQLAHF